MIREINYRDCEKVVYTHNIFYTSGDISSILLLYSKEQNTTDIWVHKKFDTFDVFKKCRVDDDIAEMPLSIIADMIQEYLGLDDVAQILRSSEWEIDND